MTCQAVVKPGSEYRHLNTEGPATESSQLGWEMGMAVGSLSCFFIFLLSLSLSHTHTTYVCVCTRAHIPTHLLIPCPFLIYHGGSGRHRSIQWGQKPALGIAERKIMDKSHTDFPLSCEHSCSLRLVFSDVMYRSQANPQRTLHLRELSYRYASISLANRTAFFSYRCSHEQAH